MQPKSPNRDDAVRIVYVTCPDHTTAQRIADALVADRLAACVSTVPGIQSTYRWQDAIQTDTESLLMIKTRAGCLDGIRSCVDQLHPDELPELIAVEVKDGSKRYLEWVVEETR